jgi:hypothetical protein
MSTTGTSTELADPWPWNCYPRGSLLRRKDAETVSTVGMGTRTPAVNRWEVRHGVKGTVEVWKGGRQ